MVTRRDFLSGTASALALPLLAGAAVAPVGAGPPRARTVDVVDRRFGLVLPDPYRWMENPQDPDWEPFMRQQAAHARARLDAMPERSRIARRIAALSGDLPAVHRIERAGARVIVEYRPAGANSYKLYALEGEADRRLLYDPERDTNAGGTALALDYWQLSPDGAHVAFGTSPGGSEDSVVRILRTRDGALLPERLDRAQYARLAWLPDSSGFFLSRLREGAVRGQPDYYDNSVVWLHRLGSDPRSDLRVVGGGDSVDGYRIAASEFPAAITAPNSPWLVLQVSGAVRRHNPLFVARLDEVRAGRIRWRSAATLDDQVTNLVLASERIYHVSERDAPNGRVLRLDLATGGPAEPVLPESEFPIEPTAHAPLMVAARDGVYFVRTHGGPQTVHRIGTDGGTIALPMPFEAGVYELMASPGADGVEARLSGWVQPFGLWRYRPDTGRFVASPLNPRIGLDLDQFASFQIMAAARDGTRVPVSVVARRDLPRDGSAPCLARCYSAYGISAAPQFNARILALLVEGGVLAQVHARGGGEFGSRWWRAGQKANKPNTWRDLIDGCLALYRARITAPSRLTIMGGSAGGIAVGRALTERPDLFAGAILNVAFTNTTRIEAEASGEAQYDEFGNPGIEADFRALHAMDSYQHVRDGQAYPAVLIMHGMRDSRVAPWHSAKLAARLQRASSSAHAVLLRVTFDAGHGPGATRAQGDAQWADMIAFTLNRSASARQAGFPTPLEPPRRS